MTQDLAIPAILVTMSFLGQEGCIAGCAVGYALLLAATVLTVVSGVHYIVRNRQVLREERDQA